jgi:hypothetical protein
MQGILAQIMDVTPVYIPLIILKSSANTSAWNIIHSCRALRLEDYIM